MAEILKWSCLGLGALFVLVPIFYYWFFKLPSVNKRIADATSEMIKEVNTVLQRHIYSNSIPALFIFVILLYLLSWKFALIFLLGSLFSITVRVFVAYFSKKINSTLLLEIENNKQGKTSDILKVMTSIFVFGFAFLALFAFKLIFNDINILYALILGMGLETFLVQINSRKSIMIDCHEPKDIGSRNDSTSELPANSFATVANNYLIFSFALVILATVAESFYPNYQNLTLLLWIIPIAGLKIFLLSLLINFLLKKIKILKSNNSILPISITILSAAFFYLIPHYLFQNDQFNPLRISLSLGLGLIVAILYHFIPRKTSEEGSVIKILPILALVFLLLLANYLAGYLGIALVITAQLSLFWVMLSKNGDNEIVHQNIVSNVFGLSAILAFFYIQKTFALKNPDEITLIASLLLGGLISYFITHYSILTSKKSYLNLLALLSILTPLAIISLFGTSYFIGLITGVLIVGILLSCIYQTSKSILYSVISTIFLLTIILKDFLQTDLGLTFKIIIACVLLVSISAFAIFKPETNE